VAGSGGNRLRAVVPPALPGRQGVGDSPLSLVAIRTIIQRRARAVVSMMGVTGALRCESAVRKPPRRDSGLSAGRRRLASVRLTRRDAACESNAGASVFDTSTIAFKKAGSG